MKRKLKPTTLLAPLPVVLVSSGGRIDRGQGEEHVCNVMTAAWAGIVNSTPPMIQISIRKERATHSLISQSGEFAVNIADSSLAKEVDFCGVKSVRDTDKFAALGLTPQKLDALEQTCGVAECAVILACKVERVLELPSHDVFIAEIVDVLADESLFDGDALDLDRISPLSYYHGNYYETGRRLGFFGFSVASPEALKRRLPKHPASKKADGKTPGALQDKIRGKHFSADRPGRPDRKKTKNRDGKPSAGEKKKRGRT